MSPESLVFLRKVRLSPPSPSDKVADADRLLEGLRSSGLHDVDIPLDILRRLPRELRKTDYELTLALGNVSSGGKGGYKWKVLDICRERLFGLAIDIGSTNIEASLFDLVARERTDILEMENPQLRFGPDVLTRVQLSMIGEYALLHRELLDGINNLIRNLCERNRIAATDILAAVVAGNTIMSHFFLGLDVDNIPLSPYIPAVNKPVTVSAEEAGLMLYRHAVVYVFPNSGSYVGGDIISGMVHAGINKEEDPVLFVDVGTNVEITLGCRDWIMVGAGAAGPALEGGVASIGKKAEAGTISKVRIRGEDLKIEMDVIADQEPAGICGSGLIDLVSEMFSADIIDQSGRMTGKGEGAIEQDGQKAYLLHRSVVRDLILTESEIKNFLVSKAAMFSFLYVFVKSVGLSFSDIKKVYVAGSLGCGINPESAIKIGMLPDIPRERFIPLGNASLAGAEKVLLDSGLLREVEDIAAKITYREMNEDSDLMHVLQGAMFIPHTDPEMLRG